MAGSVDVCAVPFKPLSMKVPGIIVGRRADGAILLRSSLEPAPVPRSIAHLFVERAEQYPQRAFLSQRESGQGRWRTISYAEALKQARSIAQWMLDRGLGAGDRVMILSGNSIEHALMTLAGYLVGVPTAPVSAAYSLLASDHGKLRECFSALGAKAVFVQDAAPFRRAVENLKALAPHIVVVAVESADEVERSIPFYDLLNTKPSAAVDAALSEVDATSVGKYLFTSGSTGTPKAVAQTHAMMCAVIGALEALRVESRGPDDAVSESLEWMPWSHISAGNIVFNDVLWSGGHLYLDDGKPTAELFPTTLRNLREVSPTAFASAPIAFGMLADALEREPALRASFFKHLHYISYGGASLSNDVYERIQAQAIAQTGFRIPMITMYGSTETQGVSLTPWPAEQAGSIGVPLPGVELKLVPNGAKLELRVKGAGVSRGYLGDDERTALAFDAEGFYKLGDAVRFVDATDPNQGLIFDGRIGEDFKLASGTWVSVGPLRTELSRVLSPYVFDAVVTGHDRTCLGILLWPTAQARNLLDVDHGNGLVGGELNVLLAAKLKDYNAVTPGSSRRVARFAVMREAPSLEAGEMTDKGYINQGATLARRRALVVALYAEPLAPGVDHLP